MIMIKFIFVVWPEIGHGFWISNNRSKWENYRKTVRYFINQISKLNLTANCLLYHLTQHSFVIWHTAPVILFFFVDSWAHGLEAKHPYSY